MTFTKLFFVSMLVFFSAACETPPALASSVGGSVSGGGAGGGGGVYGTCADVDQHVKDMSHWCHKGALVGRPVDASKKYGRQTVFSGPVGMQKGWCGELLMGSPDWAAVAVSTKYIGLHTESPKSPSCGRCMCIRIAGVDETSNAHPPGESERFFGRTLKGRVVDRCAECEDDHIDILADMPYSTAVEDEWNPRGADANARAGPRVMTAAQAYTAGVWKVEWDFAPCEADCSQFFGRSGGRKLLT